MVHYELAGNIVLYVLFMGLSAYIIGRVSGTDKATARGITVIAISLGILIGAATVLMPHIADVLSILIVSIGVYYLARGIYSVIHGAWRLPWNFKNKNTRPETAEQLRLEMKPPANKNPGSALKVAGVEYIPPKRPDPEAFNNLIGMDEAIQAIKDALEMPLKSPERIREYKINPPGGILLYGPPGTGKTCFARAAAGYFGCSFYAVNASSLVERYAGTAEQNIRELFAHARKHAPAIIFFDEIDAIGRRRDGEHYNRPSDIILQPLLGELDGFAGKQGVFVIAATNRPDVLDDALVRPGRFDCKIGMQLPGFEAREKLFKVYLRERPVKLTWQDLQQVLLASDGFAGADIRAACDQAAMRAARTGQKIDRSLLLKACLEIKGGTFR
jgi:hypothetical protein